ncbi:nucleotidyltransferase family protein [Sediminicola sp. 1XM1-17]|uniref:nucleotidyltransferase family protein n=1 Tax=Sediminicola sp. 1XM1-17 TaxID=3127702 RepID=UPI0030789EF7
MEETAPKIVILILAGGKSSRMGGIKQLLPWKGATLLENAIKQANMSNATDIMVVLGAHASEIRSKINERDVLFIENKDWESGLGTSISCGIDHILRNQIRAKGVMILLADQPLVDTAYINKLIDAFLQGSHGMITTKYGNREGVPAIFDQRFFTDLLALNKDFGAKELIKKHMHSNLGIHPDGKALDIDTQEDYLALLQRDSKENNKR